MTPEALSDLHARAMVVPAPWDARTFEAFLRTSGVFVVHEPQGFALGRVTLDEAELLTLAVDPFHHRQRIGTKLLAAFEQKAQAQKAARAFLEVAANNAAAIALYTKAGWTKNGLRKGYYRAQPSPIDAVTMSKALKSP